MKIQLKKAAITLSVFSLLGSQTLSATLLVYEGFNYGGSDAAIGGQAVGGGALGLSGSYSSVISNDGNPGDRYANYVASGLSFAGLSTSGGALEMSVTATVADKKEFAYTHIPFNATTTGNVYHSFLTKVSANTLSGTSKGDSQVRNQRTAAIIGNGDGSMVANTKRGNSGGTAPAIGYESNSSDAGGDLTTGTTYLYIAKFTNVGIAGGGDATLWVLDETGYTNWMDAGGGLEANLDSFGLMKATNSSSNQITLDTDRSMRFSVGDHFVDYNAGASNYAAAGELTVVYDELRYGTTLDSVMVIPEPSTIILLLSAGFGIIAVGYHRRTL